MSLQPPALPPVSPAILTAPPAGQPPVGLTIHNVRAPKENTYFVWVLLLSIAAWLLLAATLIGLIYAVPIALMIWLGSGLLTAYLRTEAVKVSEEQLPELHRTFRDVCFQLDVRQPPELYVLQSGGLLNAFATRFAGRDFVVVYSDMLEAVGPASPEMRFILGHEIGHIKSSHILKSIALAPGLFFPLAGPAYRRAWETSCDRYGALAAQDADAAVRAMLILSGGREHGKRLNPAAFAGQHAGERGFFVSLHELTSTYPTLSRRVTDLLALKDGQAMGRPMRHPLAYLLALFMPGGNVGGGSAAGSLLLVMVMIGLLAAMAIPAFEKVRASSQAVMCVNQQRQLQAALEQYHLEHGVGAEAWSQIAGPGLFLEAMPACPAHGEYGGRLDEEEGYTVTCSVEEHEAESVTAHPRR